MSETEPPADEPELETPIKISWSGYARGRIKGYNQDFDSEKSDRVVRTLDRQKTNVVIHTLAEAEALAEELNKYVNEAGDHGRTWVNGAIASACQRVQSEITTGVQNAGYVVDRSGLSIDFREPAEDELTAADAAEDIREYVREHGAATVTDAGMSWTVTNTEGVSADGDMLNIPGAALTVSERTEIIPGSE